MKSYNYPKIREQVKKIVKDASFSPNNKYMNTVWSHHILPVVDNALKLAKKIKADKEVIEMAAYLHDYSAIYNFAYAKDHHKHSATMAEKILKELGFPQNKIEKVKRCILNHRGSIDSNRKNIEEKIVASADAMAHFTQFADMMLLAYGIHKLDTAAGAKWLKEKLNRSWKKIMPEGRNMVKNDRDIAFIILDKAIKVKN